MKEEKIPKIIHLCWLSNEAYPPKILECINSWRQIMPDYEIMLWNEEKFKEIDNVFAKEAFAARKWAFVADYIRLYALYTYGGIYLDSDVKVYKRFDSFLNHSFFSCIEYFKPTNYIAIEAAVLGSVSGHPFVLECLEEYKSLRFIKGDGIFDFTTITVRMAQVAKKWGFQFKPEMQCLKDDIFIYPPVTFTNPSGEFSLQKTYAIHLCTGSWVEGKPRLLERVISFTKFYIDKPGLALGNLFRKIKSRWLR